MTGPCADMRLLVQADCDGELDARDAALVATHIAQCDACGRLRGDLAGLSHDLRAGLTRHTAPPVTRRALPAGRSAARRSGRPVRDFVSFGAGMAMAASLFAILARPPVEPVSGIVDAHIRALQPGHLMDVASTDRHTVKPWFDGKLDFAPPVRDFASRGYPLIGARLDYAAGRSVAVLVYGRDKHLIDVFIWPGDRTAFRQSVRGYNIEAWSQEKMNFEAVSDLNPAELNNLRSLSRNAE